MLKRSDVLLGAVLAALFFIKGGYAQAIGQFVPMPDDIACSGYLNAHADVHNDQTFTLGDGSISNLRCKLQPNGSAKAIILKNNKITQGTFQTKKFGNIYVNGIISTSSAGVKTPNYTFFVDAHEINSLRAFLR